MHIARTLTPGGLCKYCRVHLDTWGNHDVDCPHKIVELVERHVCVKAATDSYIMCLSCLEYGSNKLNLKNALTGNSTDNWKDDRYHTPLCIEYRTLFGDPGSKPPEELPKIQKAPRPESET